MVGHMTPKVGLVLQMPYVCDRKGFAGVYEKVSLLCHNYNKIYRYTNISDKTAYANSSAPDETPPKGAVCIGRQAYVQQMRHVQTESN